MADGKIAIDSTADDAETDPGPGVRPAGEVANDPDPDTEGDLDADLPPPIVAGTSKLRTRVIFAVRIIAVLAIAYYLIATTIKQWDDVQETFGKLSWTSLIAAMIAGILGMFANMMAWRASLTDLDHRIPVRTAAPIMLIGQLGKYLPGSVWAYVVQADLGRRGGVPRNRALMASLVTTGLGLTVCLAVGMLGLPTAFEATQGALPQHRLAGNLTFYAAIALLPIALVCSYPPVLTRLVKIALRLLRRPPLDRPLSSRGVLATMGWALVTCVCFGTHLWLLAQSQTASGFDGWVRCLGTISLAMGVSVFVIIAPSGIGVREFLIAVALSGFGVSFGSAYAIALASRLILTLGDVASAGLASAIGLHRLRGPAKTPLPRSPSAT